jgi:uncharacterized membrane protein HdeD (DUF308 family)
MKTPSTDKTSQDGERIPGPLHTVYRDVKRATGYWWLSVLLGLATIAVGVFALASQFNAVSTLVALAGMLLLFAGAVEFVLGAAIRPASWLAIIAGVTSSTLGIVALVWPGMTLLVLAFLVGVGLLFWGVYDIYLSLTDPVVRPRSFALASGIALVALGIIALVWPIGSGVVLGVLVGIFLVVQGVFSFVAGLRMLDAHRAMKRFEKRLENPTRVIEEDESAEKVA